MAIFSQKQVPERDSAQRQRLLTLPKAGGVCSKPGVRDPGGTQQPLRRDGDGTNVCDSAQSSGTFLKIFLIFFF